MAGKSIRLSRDKAYTPHRRRPSGPSPSFPDSDPAYQAIRLRGLAGLIRSASKNEHDLPNLDDDHDVSFLIATELREIADRLEVE